MLIRNQNKELIVILENITNIYINKYYKSEENYYKSSNPNTFLICYNEDRKLGEYSSKEKAIKVLDMIQNQYDNYLKYTTNVFHYCENCGGSGGGGNSNMYNQYKKSFIFQMPLDEEVEL